MAAGGAAMLVHLDSSSCRMHRFLIHGLLLYILLRSTQAIASEQRLHQGRAFLSPVLSRCRCCGACPADGVRWGANLAGPAAEQWPLHPTLLAFRPSFAAPPRAHWNS